MNLAIMYKTGLHDFVKAEEMYRQALAGYTKALGREHNDKMLSARNLSTVFR